MVERGGRDIGLGTTGREREGRERERELGWGGRERRERYWVGYYW